MKPVNVFPAGWSKPSLLGEPRYYYHDQNLNFDDDYVNVLDTRPMFGKRGVSRKFFDELQEYGIGPDYIILNKSTWGMDEMNMLSLHSGTKVVYPLEDVSEIHDIASSYYIDCVIIRSSRMWGAVDMINKLDNRKNMKPIWIDTTNLATCIPRDFIKLATNPMVTHCISTLVANMSAMGRLITYTWESDWSGDYLNLTTPPESALIYKYNQYVMASWCEGLSPLSFDEFLKGGK